MILILKLIIMAQFFCSLAHSDNLYSADWIDEHTNWTECDLKIISDIYYYVDDNINLMNIKHVYLHTFKKIYNKIGKIWNKITN